MVTKRQIASNGLNAHLLWKIRFDLAFSGMWQMHIPSEVLSADDKCPLGIWLYKLRFSSDEMDNGYFELVRDLHVQVHNIAGQIKQLLEVNEISTATDLLLGKFEQTSKRLMSALERWMDESPIGDSLPPFLDRQQDCDPVCIDHGHVFLKDMAQACVPSDERHRQRLTELVQLM